MMSFGFLPAFFDSSYSITTSDPFISSIANELFLLLFELVKAPTTCDLSILYKYNLPPFGIQKVEKFTPRAKASSA